MISRTEYAGIPLRNIWKCLTNQVLGVAASLAMLSPVTSNGLELDTDKKLEIDIQYPR
ncbi:hypothetical protein [Nostoc sp.]|uniref:hypothetical protein n=1 Tax=Nostoc sp. TaxID=1180 RepID=UPI002FFB56E9